jgi:hypothetical protein
MQGFQILVYEYIRMRGTATDAEVERIGEGLEW